MKEITEIRKEVTFKEVTPEEAGGRLDNYLIRELKGVPKSMVYRIIRKGEVRVNGGRTKPEYKVMSGDRIRIPPVRVSDAPVALPSPRLDKVAALENAVVYENDGLLVLNKPAHIAVHGGSGVEYGVIEALRALRPELRYLELAHRLDRETSGCLIIAKKRSALRFLHEEFREKELSKQYLALVPGVFNKRGCTVRAPLERITLATGERIVRVNENAGKPSVTEFRVRQAFRDATLLECFPKTGRTHQIRVHLAHLGFPILGDEKYGRRENDAPFVSLGLSRMFLHAEKITFQDPAVGKTVTVTAPLPPELQALLEKLEPAAAE